MNTDALRLPPRAQKPPQGRKGASSRELRTKTIALPRLNNLRPTLEMTALKLMEEAGELGAAIREYRGLSAAWPVNCSMSRRRP